MADAVKHIVSYSGTEHWGAGKLPTSQREREERKKSQPLENVESLVRARVPGD